MCVDMMLSLDNIEVLVEDTWTNITSPYFDYVYPPLMYTRHYTFVVEDGIMTFEVC